MNKYVYTEDSSDDISIYGVCAASYREAESKVMKRYSEILDDPNLGEAYDFEEFQNLLYDQYGLTVSYLEDIEEIEYK